MPYWIRLALSVCVLALLTLALALGSPRPDEVRVVAQEPNGGQIALNSPIRVTFSRAVDQRSAQQSFALVPVARGRFAWENSTLIFVPTQPLRPATLYRVTIRVGLRDSRGQPNRTMTSWSFRTVTTSVP